MAALQRTSPCLSFRDWTSAGTIRVASPSRWGKRRTALIRSPSWNDFRSAINSLVDFSFLQPPHASKQSNRTKRVRTRMVELLRRMRDCPKRGQDSSIQPANPYSFQESRSPVPFSDSLQDDHQSLSNSPPAMVQRY